jgi:hypothetical protein
MSVERSHAAKSRTWRTVRVRKTGAALTKLTDQAEESVKSMLEVNDSAASASSTSDPAADYASLAARRHCPFVRLRYPSVACTTELRQRQFPDSQQRVVEQVSSR